MTQKTGQWRREYTYGGKLAENAAQATSRELLVNTMLHIDKIWGHELRDLRKMLKQWESPIILSVYDEIVCEVPEGWGEIEEFEELMSVRPEWAKDWPISAHAWKGKRYKK